MEPRIAAVITASDGVSHGAREDGSGDAVAALLSAHGFRVAVREAIPDDAGTIRHTLSRLAAQGIPLVVITGGTGLGPRDVTPEATRAVIDREVPGLAEAMRAAGRRSTPMADLSRGVVGLRGETLIVDLPGSPRGATESLAAIVDLLPHALDLARGDTRQHPAGHGEEGVPVTADPHEHDHGRDDAHDHGHAHDLDTACALAHGDVPADRHLGTLVAIYASPVARHLLHLARETGYDTVLVEPDPGRVEDAHRRNADRIVTSADALADLGSDTDVVMTDHDRDDLGPQLAAALRTPARYVGLMGSPRHMPPHEAPLKALGVDDDQIARVRRPIGLDIGSRTPPEIAIATLAGLIAEQNDRPGGPYTA